MSVFIFIRIFYLYYILNKQTKMHNIVIFIYYNNDNVAK